MNEDAFDDTKKAQLSRSQVSGNNVAVLDDATMGALAGVIGAIEHKLNDVKSDVYSLNSASVSSKSAMKHFMDILIAKNTESNITQYRDGHANMMTGFVSILFISVFHIKIGS